MDDRMGGGEVATADPLDTEESPLAAPPHVPSPHVPAPDPEPIPLDEPDHPIIIDPDRPDLGLAEPIGDPEAPAELPAVDPDAPPPAADPGGFMRVVGRLDAIEGGLGRKLDALQTAFSREVRAESTREKVVDRLHAELQEYKQGLIQGILRPVLVDLIQLHDDMGKMVAASAPRADELGGESAPPPDRLIPTLQGYQQAIEDILYRQGVEPYRDEENPTFDPRRQRALSTVSTADPALNKTVANRLRPGFQSGDRVIRPEMVAVYAHRPA